MHNSLTPEGIVLARGQRGWTQRELAARAGIGHSTMIKIEAGRPVQRSKLDAVLHALDIPDGNVFAQAGRDLVAAWFAGLPEAEHADALRHLAAAMTTYNDVAALAASVADLDPAGSAQIEAYRAAETVAGQGQAKTPKTGRSSR